MARPDCPLCGGTASVEFFHQPSVPTNVVVLFDDPDEARAWPRGSLRLRACRGCGLVWNADVEPRLIEYSARIEDTQAFSPHFAAYAEELARDWVERHGVRGRRVLEIGCGKGEFLAMLCRIGGNRGIGFDPAARPERLPADVADRVEIVAEDFDERRLDQGADVLVCRHTLEHIPDPARFLDLLRRWALRRPHPPLLLFEVPDVARVLDEAAFWDLYYEHCCYFTADSLRHAFERSGFRVVDARTAYDGQYLLLDAVPAAEGAPLPRGPQPYAGALVRAAEAFGRRYRELAERAETRVTELRRDGPVVVWGGGAKGCAFLTATDAGPLVRAVVDVNPHKQGKYLIGTGHPVVAPAALRELRPAHVVVMNPIYLPEIGATLRELGVAATLHAANDILAPSPSLGLGLHEPREHGSSGA
jgi:SAM-dependent methyltransferase